MPEFYLIKNLITLNFGGNNKNSVAIGEKSEGGIAFSSALKTGAVDLPKKSAKQGLKQLKTPKKS